MNLNEQSDRDFSRARRRAFLRRVGAYLRGDPGSNQLLSFDEVKDALGVIQQVHIGLREVPVSKIVGSVGRHRDFDRAFLPSKPDLGTRWKRIDQLMYKHEELPPVSLFKIGDAYFVNDGNHRVSVARQQGVETLDADVVELRSRVPVDSALTAESLLHKLELRHLPERPPVRRGPPGARGREPVAQAGAAAPSGAAPVRPGAAGDKGPVLRRGGLPQARDVYRVARLPALPALAAVRRP